MLKTLLGLAPDAFARRLRILRPVLPDFVDRLTLRRLRVGASSVDLGFRRSKSGRVTVKVLRVEGKLDVQVLTQAYAYSSKKK
jgi:hypothetical protein